MDPENITLANATEATSDLWIRVLPQHVKVGPMPAGPVSPLTLPIRELESRPATLKHFLDIIYDFEGPINHDQLGPILRDQAWDELPAPFGFQKKLEVKFLMQVFIRTQANGKHCIVKHVFLPDNKIKASLVSGCGYGTLHEVVWGHNPKTTKKALQFMLEQMGGIQYRLFVLAPEQKKKVKAVMEKSEEELEKGFQYIREHGERDKGNLKQLLWIQKNVAANSPIKGWKDGLVQRCLDSLATDATMADLITRSDLVISDFEDEIQDLFFKIVPYLREHAIWVLGEPGKGKTPLGRVLAMMFSRYHGGVGSYRSGSDFDYFRGCPFSTAVPAIYDDGEIGLEPVKKKKAFSDVADTETLTRERWTAAKFKQNQLRVVIDNAYERVQEPEIVPGPNPTISHDDFVKMIRPALGDISSVDTMAIFKRSVFFLVTKTSVYWRLPGPLEKPINRKSWLLPDLIKASAKPIIANFKRKGPPPANQESRILWENAWLLEAIRQHDHPDQAPVPRPCPESIRVKRERLAFAQSLSSQSVRAPIELDSPSPAKRARQGECNIRNPDFAGLPPNPDADEELQSNNGGDKDDLEQELEKILEEKSQKSDDEMDVVESAS
ncbi:unnamed protein product [Symbiodinium sp. CCMP2592]|nr:unnamed protein product [Symbiodinium sp. CCMP2592]